MNQNRWKRISRWALIAILLLSLAGYVAERINRGIVMRPVRKLANEIGITISFPKLTAEEKTEARAMAKAWKRECLEKYPILKMDSHPVPDEENGFLMLYQLDQGPRITEEFQQFLSEWRYDDGQKLNTETAKRLVKEHAEYVAHIEHISSLNQRSSTNMPDGYVGFISARGSKQAAELFMLQASLAADKGAGNEALHYFTLIGNLSDHFLRIETPFLLSETVAIIVELSRQEFAIKQVLPKLGPSSDLQSWRSEFASLNYLSPQRFATILKGEWNTSAEYMTFPLLAMADKEGSLSDGKGCAMAYAAWIAEQALKMNTASSWSDIEEEDLEARFKLLPTEQESMMSILSTGISSWARGIQRSARASALNLAVLDLLILERAKGSFAVTDTQQITLDPITGEPFIFDPRTRTLRSPDTVGITFDVEPVTLPW